MLYTLLALAAVASAGSPDYGCTCSGETRTLKCEDKGIPSYYQHRLPSCAVAKAANACGVVPTECAKTCGLCRQDEEVFGSCEGHQICYVDKDACPDAFNAFGDSDKHFVNCLGQAEKTDYEKCPIGCQGEELCGCDADVCQGLDLEVGKCDCVFQKNRPCWDVMFERCCKNDDDAGFSELNKLNCHFVRKQASLNGLSCDAVFPGKGYRKDVEQFLGQNQDTPFCDQAVLTKVLEDKANAVGKAAGELYMWQNGGPMKFSQDAAFRQAVNDAATQAGQQYGAVCLQALNPATTTQALRCQCLNKLSDTEIRASGHCKTVLTGNSVFDERLECKARLKDFTFTAPFVGEWNTWGEFSTCTETCGGGERTRTRTCKSGDCDKLRTKGSETEDCNTEACPADYGDWTKKTECSVTCGEGFNTFERTCTGSGCEESKKTENRPCNLAVCPACGDIPFKDCKKKGKKLGCFKWKKSYCMSKDDLAPGDKLSLCNGFNKKWSKNPKKAAKKCRKKSGGACKVGNNECVVA